ncbi:MAG: hypothetical protein CVU43_04585 [Chloroflexi bacterium HGW-Chloroflexi-5]|jgi:hypothetical protein|nr:MAG: hypothetical protein CVU43_04585 [Chloroflexi bacterium HGW-Chloroflexi-5]
MSGKADNVSDFMLNHMKRSDMRPKEDFKKLDLVRVSGGHITGRIMAFDPDMRLAHVDSTIGPGWWYLKDLELENSGSRKDAKSQSKAFEYQAELIRVESLFGVPARLLHEAVCQ